MRVISEEKKQLRRSLISSRQILSLEDIKQSKDENLFLKVTSDNYYIEANTVLCFVSTDIETDTRMIIKDCFDKRKKIAVPVSGECTLTFRYITSFDDLEPGRYGIFEPVYACQEVCENDIDKETLCLVPGLAFDRSGHRIGYGKGYYDRFLTSFTGRSIGICYKEYLFDKIPTDDFDMKVDRVITD